MNKEKRVRKNEEFNAIIKQKHSKATKTFIVYYTPKSQDKTRVGISVSKKLGNAVVRNKIKRQLRMMIMEVLDFDSAIFDYIVIVRQDFLLKSYEENKKALEKTIKYCNII